MKKLSKNKKIAIIVAVVLVIAIAVGISIVAATKKGGNEADNNSLSSSLTSAEDVTEYVTELDENGKPVIKKDENGNPVTKKVQSSGNTGTDKPQGSSDDEDTTEPLTHFTTIPSNQPIETPDMPMDDYKLTESLALYLLQNYYGDDYVVNYDEPNNKDGDNIAYAVFVNDENGTTIAYTVMVNIYDGNAIETDSKGKTKDISKEIAF